MSTFDGRVEEIPGISIDYFDGDNLKSSLFFLSHCHTDHMHGLGYDFFNHLMKNDKLFYCSHISKSFLKNKYSNLDSAFVDKFIVETPMDEPKILNYKINDTSVNVTVTSISSGHCPGAVMFLFDYNDQRILYTGDFRINKEDYRKIKSLHYGDLTQLVPLKIQKIYLDTTFLNLNFLEFPTRLESSRELCLAVKEWIEKDPKNVVILEISALIGSEFIYTELYKMLNKKIHVKNNVYQIYSRMDILANCVTNIGESTPIHACTNKTFKKTFGLKCRENIEHSSILTIIPSVQKWSGKNTSVIIEWDEIREQTKNVCYSTHASYNELEAFILYFKPKEVYPCVCHDNEKKNIHQLLRRIISRIRHEKDDLYASKPTRLRLSNHKIFKKSHGKSNFLSDDEDDS